MAKRSTKPKLYLKLSGSKGPAPRGSSLSVEFLNRPGIFETMRAYGGRVLGLGEHLARLGESARGAGQKLAWSGREIGAFVTGGLKRSGEREALARLAVVFGEARQAMTLVVRGFEPYAAERYERGLEIQVSSVRKDSPRASNPQVKSNNYVGSVMAFFEPGAGSAPAAPGGFDTLFLNAEGFLTEGTVSNFAIVKNAKLLTPPAASGILRGVTRALVMESARRLGMDFEETNLTRHDLYNADEAFVTTTLSELMPITACDRRRIGSGRRGPWTKRLHEEFRRLTAERIERETGSEKRKTKRK